MKNRRIAVIGSGLTSSLALARLSEELGTAPENIDVIDPNDEEAMERLKTEHGSLMHEEEELEVPFRSRASVRQSLSALQALAFAGGMNAYDFGHGGGSNTLTPDQIDVRIKVLIPKGCKEYHFFKEGEEPLIYHWHMEYTHPDTSFTCIASSIKSAKTKFSKFLIKQNNG